MDFVKDLLEAGDTEIGKAILLASDAGSREIKTFKPSHFSEFRSESVGHADHLQRCLLLEGF